MNIYALGTVFVQIALGMNAFITAQGFSRTSMLTVLIGAVLNIALDPLFMFTFGMGVKGAALATILSQAVSAAWVLWFLCGRKTVLHLRFAYMAPRPRLLAPCLALGVSPFIMQATEAAINVCFNRQLALYGGALAVSSMTILASVMQFAMLPLQGLTQGAQPITSYNYGAKNPARVRASFRGQPQDFSFVQREADIFDDVSILYAWVRNSHVLYAEHFFTDLRLYLRILIFNFSADHPFHKRIFIDILDGVNGHEFTVAHDGDAVGKLVNLVQLMGNKYNGHAFRLQCADKVKQYPGFVVRQGARRLVQHHDFGFFDNSPHDGKELKLAAVERPCRGCRNRNYDGG